MGEEEAQVGHKGWQMLLDGIRVFVYEQSEHVQAGLDPLLLALGLMQQGQRAEQVACL